MLKLAPHVPGFGWHTFQSRIIVVDSYIIIVMIFTMFITITTAITIVVVITIIMLNVTERCQHIKIAELLCTLTEDAHKQLLWHGQQTNLC
jgi:hypothetical protein